MQKKRTFMTAPDMVVESDSDDDQSKQQFSMVPPKDIFEEYQDMLKDVLDTQKAVRGNTDDLEELRLMIKATKENIGHHITTVD